MYRPTYTVDFTVGSLEEAEREQGTLTNLTSRLSFPLYGERNNLRSKGGRKMPTHLPRFPRRPRQTAKGGRRMRKIRRFVRLFETGRMTLSEYRAGGQKATIALRYFAAGFTSE